MGAHQAQESFTSPETLDISHIPLVVTLQTLQAIHSILLPLGSFGKDFSVHLQNIIRSLQAYAREENLTLPFFSDMESLLHIAHGGLNIGNPYHSFLEGQKSRKLFFETALSQIEYMKKVNLLPFMVPYLQQLENFIRTNLAFTFTFDRPDWQLEFQNETVGELDFCDVVKFSPKEGTSNGKNMLLVAPMSGHFATLLRKTIESLCRDGYTVFITDWRTPLNISQEIGRFDTQRYTQEIQNVFGKIQSHIGAQDFHALAVCQPSPETLTAVAHAEKHNLAKPISLALMAGPIDTSRNPTQINFSAEKLSPEVMQALKLQAPYNKKGSPRAVYPAALQIMGFIMTKPEEHMKNFLGLAMKTTPFTQEEEKMLHFYKEYFAVMDLSFEFYEDTVETIFRRNEYAKGKIYYLGEMVDFGEMQTPLITLEAANDDITGLGQTQAANEFCTSAILNKYVRVTAKDASGKVGHYGIFAGERFRSVVMPNMANFIQEVEALKKAA